MSERTFQTAFAKACILKKIVDGSEFFDGQKVSIHQGRFTGKFDLDEIDGVTISTGDQVTFMVTGIVTGKQIGRASCRERVYVLV